MLFKNETLEGRESNLQNTVICHSIEEQWVYSNSPNKRVYTLIRYPALKTALAAISLTIWVQNVATEEFK